jgi:hypothetical protein
VTSTTSPSCSTTPKSAPGTSPQAIGSTARPEGGALVGFFARDVPAQVPRKSRTGHRQAKHDKDKHEEERKATEGHGRVGRGEAELKVSPEEADPTEWKAPTGRQAACSKGQEKAEIQSESELRAGEQKVETIAEVRAIGEAKQADQSPSDVKSQGGVSPTSTCVSSPTTGGMESSAVSVATASGDGFALGSSQRAATGLATHPGRPGPLATTRRHPAGAAIGRPQKTGAPSAHRQHLRDQDMDSPKKYVAAVQSGIWAADLWAVGAPSLSGTRQPSTSKPWKPMLRHMAGKRDGLL